MILKLPSSSSIQINFVLHLPSHPIPPLADLRLARFAADEHAVAAINGGFLRTATPATPAGLLKFGGHVLNRISPESQLGGVVCFNKNDNQIKFTTPSDSYAIERADSCLQAGPLLLAGGAIKDNLEEIDQSNGLNDKFSAGGYIRSFFARTDKGRIVLGVTSPTSLFAVRHYLQMPAAGGGIGAVDAINLSGVATAGLMVRGDQTFIVGEKDLLLPNAIVAKSRGGTQNQPKTSDL
jgi:Phosphodiester glycosidase